jgi:hypothetical protein
MIKSILPASVLSLMMLSAACAGSIAPKIDLPTLGLVQVKDYYNNKHYKQNYNYKHYNYNNNYKHYGRYHYGNRYWSHRYYSRPYNWDTIGCIVVGPVWYCP